MSLKLDLNKELKNIFGFSKFKGQQEKIISSTNDLEIKKHNTSEHFQKIYYKQLSKWSEEEKVLTFLFEAFDEPWKGSNDPFEPEKHWGVFKEDRTPKIAMKKEVYKK